MQMQELIKQIEQWGREKGIDNCDPLMQTTKTAEEVNELLQAVIKYTNNLKEVKNCGNDPTIVQNRLSEFTEDIKDAIGDVFITLVMLSIQDDRIILRTNLNTNYSTLSNDFILVACLNDELNQLQLKLIHNGPIEEEWERFNVIDRIIGILKQLSANFLLDFNECVEHSYNEIKDRKGEIVDGLWNKVESLCEPAVYKAYRVKYPNTVEIWFEDTDCDIKLAEIGELFTVNKVTKDNMVEGVLGRYDCEVPIDQFRLMFEEVTDNV